MAEHEIKPEVVKVDFTGAIYDSEPYLLQVSVLQRFIAISNTALSEYGIEIAATTEYEGADFAPPDAS
jgi:hypothetical protein